MTTRTLAAVAEELSLLAEDMAEVAGILRANSSRVPARPHLSMLNKRALSVATALRKNCPDCDGSISMAREIVSWCEVWLCWRESASGNQADKFMAVWMDIAISFVESHAGRLRS